MGTALNFKNKLENEHLENLLQSANGMGGVSNINYGPNFLQCYATVMFMHSYN